jgi:hypothetical protein
MINFNCSRLVRFIYIVVPLFLLAAYQLNAQLALTDIDLERVPEQEVEDYLYMQMGNELECFKDIKPSLSPGSSTMGFRFHENEYVIKDSLQKVWQHYVGTNPAEAWNAGKFDFGLLFSRTTEQVYYPNQKINGIETGQIIYLNLHLAKGIKKLCTAFEIIQVDEAERIIEFSYVEDNFTKGKQQMRFVTMPNGKTKIIHRSFFKSHSTLRDHFLYPYFHTRLTNNYHRNMKKLYQEKMIN